MFHKLLFGKHVARPFFMRGTLEHMDSKAVLMLAK